MSRFLDEIAELPDALRRMTAHYRGPGRALLDAWAQRMHDRTRVLFSGMGTSHFAPLAEHSRLARVGIACEAVDAGEWLHFGQALPGEAGQVVLVSQSGESVEVKLLVEAKRAGGDFVAITNHADSTLGQSASLVLEMLAGEEAAISTKTYSNTLGLVHLMAAALAGPPEVDAALDRLDQAAECLAQPPTEQIAEAAAFLLPAESLACVGRGPANVAARQCALTFMEGAHLLAASFTGGAFRHGPFELSGPDMRVIVFSPAGQAADITEAMGREAGKLGSRVVLVTDADASASENVKVIRVPTVTGEASEELFPLLASATHALLLDHVARGRGVEAGQFRYGGKITTRQ